jgi:hypothetical protein
MMMMMMMMMMVVVDSVYCRIWMRGVMFCTRY